MDVAELSIRVCFYLRMASFPFLAAQFVFRSVFRFCHRVSYQPIARRTPLALVNIHGLIARLSVLIRVLRRTPGNGRFFKLQQINELYFGLGMDI